MNWKEQIIARLIWPFMVPSKIVKCANHLLPKFLFSAVVCRIITFSMFYYSVLLILKVTATLSLLNCANHSLPKILFQTQHWHVRTWTTQSNKNNLPPNLLLVTSCNIEDGYLIRACSKEINQINGRESSLNDLWDGTATSQMQRLPQDHSTCHYLPHTKYIDLTYKINTALFQFTSFIQEKRNIIQKQAN